MAHNKQNLSRNTGTGLTFLLVGALCLWLVSCDKKFNESQLKQADERAMLLDSLQNDSANDQKKAKEDEDARYLVVSSPLEGDPFEEMNSLIGLESVKSDIVALTNFVKVQKERESEGLKTAKPQYHCIFTGRAGTGKATIARILARMYKDLGVISRGQLVETDRSGLVGRYAGQTAKWTNAAIDSAMNGVLFIDNAYSIIDPLCGEHGDEAIATLLKRLNETPDSLVVILSCEADKVEPFVNYNPELKRLFTRTIDFPDYSADELYEIFITRAKNYDYQLDDEADELLKEKLNEAVEEKGKDFNNGSFARTIFEKAIINQANRLVGQNASKKELQKLTADDISSAFETKKPAQ